MISVWPDLNFCHFDKEQNRTEQKFYFDTLAYRLNGHSNSVQSMHYM